MQLEAEPGLTVILGPNGAGKTHAAEGARRPDPAPRRWSRSTARICRTKTHEIVQAGVALVAEGRQLFPQMSVRENLELGGWLVPKAERARRLEQAFDDFPKLRERAHQLAGTMSGGEQQMVAVARAMMSAPRLLMLDEPSLGLAPKMVDELLAIARRIADAGTTVLMVEQNVKKALAVADRGYVLERGALVAQRAGRAAGAFHRGARGLPRRRQPPTPPPPPMRHARRACRHAGLRSSQENPMSDLSMLINGLKVSAEKGATFERRNPLDGTVATRAPAARRPMRVMAVEAAAEAFRTWSETGPGERRALLLKAADALEAKTPQFIEAVAAETGATGMWAGFNVMLAAGMIREAAALTTQIGGRGDPSGRAGLAGDGPARAGRRGARHRAVERADHPRRARHRHAAGLRQHRGPEGQRELPAHAPADHRGASQEAGFPPGVVNYITNAPADAGAVVEAMVAHPAVRRVNFTGSTRVGRLIAMTCAKYLKPVVLELGGKAPLVVLDDADIDDAVNAAAFGASPTAGQICMSTERIIVDQKVADEFVKKFADKASGLPLGDPRKPEPVVLGSVIGMRTVAALQRADRRRAGQGRQAGVRRQGRDHADAGHRARPRDAERCASTARRPSAR